METLVTSPVVISSDPAPVDGKLAEVRAKSELLREARLTKVAEHLDAELAMESLTINQQEFVSRWDYRPVGHGFDQNILGYGGGVSWQSRQRDREDGKHAPFVEDEHDLAYIRGIARYV